MQRKRRRWLWLVAAAVLLTLGAWLMLSTEPPLPVPPPDVSLPRRITRQEVARNEQRRSWLPAPALDAGAPALQRPRDPMMAALPPEVKRAVVVVEANAIRNSELGDLLVDCFFAGDERTLPFLRDAGLDPLTQIDRVAIADDTLIVTGDFSKTRWEALAGDFTGREAYGPRGEVFERALTDGGPSIHLGLWNKQMVVVGEDVEGLKQVLDRLDGSGPVRPSVLSESQAYGEVYGVLQASALADLVGRDDEALGDVIRESAKQIELHVDVSKDVGLVAEVQANDPAKSEDLRKSLGSALALARLRAQTQGKTDEAQVLELARVHSAEGGAHFKLEAGLPYDFLAKSLKRCVEERPRRREERRQRAQAQDAG